MADSGRFSGGEQIKRVAQGSQHPLPSSQPPLQSPPSNPLPTPHPPHCPHFHPHQSADEDGSWERFTKTRALSVCTKQVYFMNIASLYILFFPANDVVDSDDDQSDDHLS